MLIRNKNLTALIGGVAFAGSAAAAELAATKAAPIQSIFPNAYSEVELSHHLKRQPAASADNSRVDATYKLGSTFFDNTLDSFFVVGTRKYVDSARFEAKAVDWETYLTAYSNDFMAIKPYVLASLPHVDHAGNHQNTKGRFGVQLPLNYEVSTPAGAVSLGAYYDGAARINNSHKVKLTENGEPVTRSQVEESRFALSSDRMPQLGLVPNSADEYEVQAQALAVRQEAGVTFGYKPNILQGLAFEWRTRHILDSDPLMEYDPATEKVAPRSNNLIKQEYRHLGRTNHRLRAKYDINETLYVHNDFSFENKLVDDKLNYMNVLAVGARLF